MKLLLLSFVLLSSALAGPIKGLEKAVATDFNSVLGDTVNEGDMEASVKSVVCTVAPTKKDPNVNLAKCEAQIKVKITLERPYLKCETSCFLLYKLAKKDLRTLEPVGDLEDRCIENVSTTDCQ